jgi:hypothetical protein
VEFKLNVKTKNDDSISKSLWDRIVYWVTAFIFAGLSTAVPLCFIMKLNEYVHDAAKATRVAWDFSYTRPYLETGTFLDDVDTLTGIVGYFIPFVVALIFARLQLNLSIKLLIASFLGATAGLWTYSTNPNSMGAIHGIGVQFAWNWTLITAFFIKWVTRRMRLS